MKLESIFKLWEEDCVINPNELGEEAIKISRLHSKYHQIYTNERLVLRKYETELKVLRLDKFEFYTQGPTKETLDKGWKLPDIGRILKADANNYIDADKDIIELTLKIGIQHEKITLLDSILKTLHGRSYNLRAAVDWAQFQAGF
jgi:hypothetical protein